VGVGGVEWGLGVHKAPVELVTLLLHIAGISPPPNTVFVAHLCLAMLHPF
jgi:hypothetical protein